MIKTLRHIRTENDELYHESGDLISSVEKSYFHYDCHEADAVCQLKPVVCRVFDKMKPANEAVWSVDECECKRCFATNDRLLEDLYR